SPQRFTDETWNGYCWGGRKPVAYPDAFGLGLRTRRRLVRRIWTFVVVGLVSAQLASAQDVGGKTTTNPDDTPTVRIGGTIYADYLYQTNPAIVDTDGNSVKLNQFTVGRAYINVIGTISHLISFRITPDITREGGVTNALNGSLVYRIKYAYAQV